MSHLFNLRELAATGAREADRLRSRRSGAGMFGRRNVGSYGRQLFLASKIWRYAARPRLERFYWNILKPIFALVLILWYTPRYASTLRRDFGIGLREQIVQQCRLGFRDWVNPRCYYFHEHYLRPGPVDCSGYVMRHECKEGLMKVLHKLRPRIARKRIHLGHKNNFAQACVRFGLPAVPVIGIATRGKIRIIDRTALTGDLFVKPEIGRGAVGAKAFRRCADGTFARNGRKLPLAALLARVARNSWLVPQILQPMLRNHPGLADLAEQSLITIRVITCMDAAGQPVITHAMLRTLSKLEPTWPGHDEYAAPIGLDSGRMGLLCGDTAIGPRDWLEHHPMTGAPVLGRVVPQWSAIRALALAAHHAFGDRMLIGWDIAMTPEGPILIEANSYPDTEFLQRVHRQSIGDSPLGPLLAYQLQRVVEVHGGRRVGFSDAP